MTWISVTKEMIFEMLVKKILELSSHINILHRRKANKGNPDISMPIKHILRTLTLYFALSTGALSLSRVYRMSISVR